MLWIFNPFTKYLLQFSIIEFKIEGTPGKDNTFLVIKTIESNVVKTLTDKDIATITPIATEKLKTMNKNIYDN